MPLRRANSVPACLVTLLLVPVLLSAGVNSSASVRLVVPGVSTADSCRVMPGPAFIVALEIRGASSAHSISAKISYDHRVIRFDGAQKALSPDMRSFLESNGGTLAALLSVPGDSTVDIAGALSGSARGATASGTGIAAYLKFSVVKAGDPRLAVREALIVDENCVVDTVRCGR